MTAASVWITPAMSYGVEVGSRRFRALMIPEVSVWSRL